MNTNRPLHYIIMCLTLLLPALWLTSCHDDTVYDSLPRPISEFVSEYYPGSDVSSYTTDKAGISTVKVTDGPTITFSKDYTWISLDANGNTVPDMFLFDQLPPALYEYLQSTQATHSVYSVTRDAHKYRLRLFDSNLTYDIATSQITGVPRP